MTFSQHSSFPRCNIFGKILVNYSLFIWHSLQTSWWPHPFSSRLPGGWLACSSQGRSRTGPCSRNPRTPCRQRRGLEAEIIKKIFLINQYLKMTNKSFSFLIFHFGIQEYNSTFCLPQHPF